MKKCPFCAELVQDDAIKCRYCHESLSGADAKWQEFGQRYKVMSPEEQARAWNKLSASQQKVASAVLAGQPVPSATSLAGSSKSNGVAFLLGLFLGPVGLWYKGQWAAGFAWIVMIFLIALGTGGLGIVLAPFFWIGMAVHAAVAAPRE